MRTLLFAIVIVAVIAVLALDGFGIYSARETAGIAAKSAADQAVLEYQATSGNQIAAEQAALDAAIGANVSLVSATFHKAETSRYEVTVKAEPRSYLLKYIPFLKTRLAQESTAVVNF